MTFSKYETFKKLQMVYVSHFSQKGNSKIDHFCILHLKKKNLIILQAYFKGTCNAHL